MSNGPDGYDQADVACVAEALHDFTGHVVTDQLLPACELLMSAVRTDSGGQLAEALAQAEQVTGDRLGGVIGMAMLLAAGVDHDQRLPPLVEWITEKRTYRQARAGGLTHTEAARYICAMRAGERGTHARELLDAADALTDGEQATEDEAAALFDELAVRRRAGVRPSAR